MPPRRIALRTLAFGLVACVMQATSADASVIVIGSPVWERLQELSVSAAPAETATKPVYVEADSPWRQGSSLGAAGAGMPIVLSRRDDGPAAAYDDVRPDHRLTLRHTERRRLLTSPPVSAGVFRPPKAAPATANVV